MESPTEHEDGFNSELGLATLSPLVTKVVKGKGAVVVPEGIDPGFAYHPGKAGLAARQN